MPKFFVGRVSAINVKRKENRVSWDTMILISMIRSQMAIIEMLKQWEHKKTRFFLSTKCIDEAYGILMAEGWKKKDFNKQLDKIIKTFRVTRLKYDKKIDEIGAIHLFKVFKKRYKRECHPPDARIVSHFQRENINIAYSQERDFRLLCDLVGIEGRNFPTIEGGIPRQILRRLLRHRR